MSFDLNTWKKKLSENLKNWKPRMQRAGVNSTYAMLSAASVYPVVEAARNGEWAALSALGVVVAGVGTNLLANMIQNWKNETTGAKEIEQTMKEEPALRGELDAVLTKLDTLTLATQELSLGDRMWFERKIQNELAALGSSVKYEANLVGDGAIAQGNGAISVGARGAHISGNNNIVTTGDGNTINTAPDPRQIEAEKQADLRRRYLERQLKECQQLSLAALGGEEGSEEYVTLEKVFVELDTTQRVEIEKTNAKKDMPTYPEQDERAISAIEAFSRNPRLALLGDPGSGKSTFAKFILAWQAAAELDEKKNYLPGCEKGLLPVLVTLRDLTPHLMKLQPETLTPSQLQNQCTEAVLQVIGEYLQHCRLAKFQPQLLETLEAGKCLLALDGLDEVPQKLHPLVHQAVNGLLHRYLPGRILITCRARSYIGEAVLLNFQAFTLAPFDEEKIQQFVQGWYNLQEQLGNLNAAQASEKANNLTEAALTADLQELSSNPMMLTSMAIIHQKEIGLPKERVRLYKLVVDVLLLRWQKQKVCGSELGDFLKDDLLLHRVIERLAYEAHITGKAEKEAADLPRGLLLTLLESREYFGKTVLADEFLDYVDQRAGLLVGRGGEDGKPLNYGFPHRTLQEYLAGCYLVGKRSMQREYFDLAGEGDYWSIAAQLGAEELYFNRQNLNGLLDLAYYLCAPDEPIDEHSWRALVWSAHMASLAGHNKIEADADHGGRYYLKRLIPWLVIALGKGLPAFERAGAGRVLARLGDPRPEVMTCSGMQFCWVPAGFFQMGSDERHDSFSQEDERPLHPAESHAYAISKYPVTQAQYAEFVQAGGYQESALWREAAKAGYWQDGTFKGIYDEKPRTTLVDFGEKYMLPNQPVVGISWYEALAFCRWLNRDWTEKGFLSSEMKIRLPYEMEWEKAARGGVLIPAKSISLGVSEIKGAIKINILENDNPQPARRYPWGDETDKEKANTYESGIGFPSAVGCFPCGASPYGLLDVSGNVWEWTCSVINSYNAKDVGEEISPESIVILRGGSFYDSSRYARCAYRGGVVPGSWDDYFGFRVVLSTF